MNLRINNRIYNSNTVISVEKKTMGIRAEKEVTYGVIIVHTNGQEKILQTKDEAFAEKVLSVVSMELGPYININTLVEDIKEEYLKEKEKTAIPVKEIKEEIQEPKKTRRRREAVDAK